MARAISVKVSTPKVIKALEAKLDNNKKIIADNEKKRKENDKAHKAWAKDVADVLMKQIGKAESVSAHENWRNEVSVNVTMPAGVVKLPEQPKCDLERELGSYEIQEIENAIRILQMTEEEFVNASTFKTVAQYL